MKRLFTALTLLVGVAALGGGASCDAQSAPKYSVIPFNVFTTSQDIELGQQSAGVAEKQMSMLNAAPVDRVVNQIVTKLAAFAPGAKYPYTVKVVNGSDINAFALPGGPIYVTRGLIDATRTEAQLASVVAHMMAHIAMRHGTAHASYAYLGKTGFGLLGGLVGKGANTASLVTTIGGPGLNATFMKFSGDDESEADRVGVVMMARAGYSPSAMGDLFAVLRQEQIRTPSKTEMLFNDHPPAAERETSLRKAVASTPPAAPASETGEFKQMRVAVLAQPAASTSGFLPASPSAKPPPQLKTPDVHVRVAVTAPATTLVKYSQPNDFFTISRPSNWQSIQMTGQFAATLAPNTGVVTLPNGRQVIVYGIVLNHYQPFETESMRWESSAQANYAPFDKNVRPRGVLEDATDDLVRMALRANAYLKAAPGSAKAEPIEDARAYSVMLTGISPVTGEEEKVKVFVRSMPDMHVIYALCVAPTRDFDVLDRTFDRMIRTLDVNEEAVHGTVQQVKK